MDGDILQTGYGCWVKVVSETAWIVANSLILNGSKGVLENPCFGGIRAFLCLNPESLEINAPGSVYPPKVINTLKRIYT